MVKVLEKRIEESYRDKVWRIVAGATAEIVGQALVLRNLQDYFNLDEKRRQIPEDARIVAVRDMDMIYVDAMSQDNKKVEQGIIVHPQAHYLFIYDSAHFDLARQLAEAYERRLEEGPDRQFTLQKEYQG